MKKIAYVHERGEYKNMKNKKEKKQEEEELTGMAAVWDYLKTFLIIFCVVFAMNKLVYINAVIPSESMQNTIMKGDRVLGNRLAYIKDDPERYDIVIFKYPDDPSKIFIKRVIGLPGETVTVKDGKIYIDGKEQTQAVSFCPEEMAGSFGPYEVPEDSYFVMGDNRNNSLDSRYWDNINTDITCGGTLAYYDYAEYRTGECAQPPGRLNAVHAGHGDIHQRHVRMMSWNDGFL